MAARVPRPQAEPKGRAKPRIAPPTPARSRWKDIHERALEIGITLMPWQDEADKYLTALGPGDKWLYPEVAVIVGRQNGKTELLKPNIVDRLLAGQRIMHTAQNAKLPRDIHDAVATAFLEHFPDALPRKRAISYAVGHEEIKLKNGGHYRIVAPTKNGARGPANDTVIVDELRELEDHEFIGSAEPTLSASPNPQIIFLSNAGTEDSEVLNSIKARSDTDRALAYLEWSAAPERRQDDVAGWLEANPSSGHMPGKMDYLRRKFISYQIAKTLGIFEVEHLCRWMPTTAESILAPDVWPRLQGEVSPMRRPSLALNMDQSGTKATVALAWPAEDDMIDVVLQADVTGEPVDVPTLGRDVKARVDRLGVRESGFDPATDQDLKSYVPKARPINGAEYANACEKFVRLALAGKIRWQHAEIVGTELTVTTKRQLEKSWMAVKANDAMPITSVLAVIRAVWLASAVRPSGVARTF